MGAKTTACVAVAMFMAAARGQCAGGRADDDFALSGNGGAEMGQIYMFENKRKSEEVLVTAIPPTGEWVVVVRNAETGRYGLLLVQAWALVRRGEPSAIHVDTIQVPGPRGEPAIMQHMTVTPARRPMEPLVFSPVSAGLVTVDDALAELGPEWRKVCVLPANAVESALGGVMPAVWAFTRDDAESPTASSQGQPAPSQSPPAPCDGQQVSADPSP